MVYHAHFEKVIFKSFLILFAGFILILFLTSLGGQSFKTSFWGTETRQFGLLTYFHCFLFIFLVSQSSFFKTHLELLFLAPLASALVSTLIGLFEAFNSPPSSLVKISANLGNSNFLGQYLGLLFPIAICFFVASTNLYTRAFWALALLLVSLGLVLSQCWGVWFAFFLVASIIYLFKLSRLLLIDLFKPGTKFQVFDYGLILSFILGVGSFVFIMLFVFPSLGVAYANPYLKSLPILKDFNWPTILVKSQVRRELLFLTGEFIRSNSLFGVGLENFGNAFLSYKTLLLESFDRHVFYDKPHNVYLEYWATAGVFGFLGYLFIVLWPLKDYINRFFTPISHSSYDFNFTLFISVLIYCISSLFSFHDLSVFLLFLLMLSVLSSRSVGWPDFSFNHRVNRYLVFLFLSASFFSGLYQIKYLQSCYYVKQGLLSPLSTSRMNYFCQATKVSPFQNVAIQKIAQAYLFPGPEQGLKVLSKAELDFIGSNLASFSLLTSDLENGLILKMKYSLVISDTELAIHFGEELLRLSSANDGLLKQMLYLYHEQGSYSNSIVMATDLFSMNTNEIALLLYIDQFKPSLKRLNYQNILDFSNGLALMNTPDHPRKY